MFMKRLPDQVTAFLNSHNLVTIATMSKDTDYPFVTPVFYVVDENNTLYFASHAKSNKIHNITSHPHIGLSITDVHVLQSLGLQGAAVVGKQHPEIIQKILAISSNNSDHAFPPIMQIKDGAMELVTVTIHWYRLSTFSWRDPGFIEGTL